MSYVYCDPPFKKNMHTGSIWTNQQCSCTSPDGVFRCTREEHKTSTVSNNLHQVHDADGNIVLEWVHGTADKLPFFHRNNAVKVNMKETKIKAKLAPNAFQKQDETVPTPLTLSESDQKLAAIFASMPSNQHQNKLEEAAARREREERLFLKSHGPIDEYDLIPDV